VVQRAERRSERGSEYMRGENWQTAFSRWWANNGEQTCAMLPVRAPYMVLKIVFWYGWCARAARDRRATVGKSGE
jgi:hypothetical protein